MKPYLYRLEADFTYQSPHLAGISFCNDWLLIEGGSILIRAGYAWDGCSPKWAIGRWVIGTPDGPLMSDGWRQTGRASLVHDALCQFKREIPITQAQTLALFGQLLAEARWPYRRLYVWAVDAFGPPHFGGDLYPSGSEALSRAAKKNGAGCPVPLCGNHFVVVMAFSWSALRKNWSTMQVANCGLCRLASFTSGKPRRLLQSCCAHAEKAFCELPNCSWRS